MSKLTGGKLLLYFLIAALTEALLHKGEPITVWILIASFLQGCIAIKAFIDRSYARDTGVPQDPPDSIAGQSRSAGLPLPTAPPHASPALAMPSATGLPI